ncbi:hypothetical protein IW262DRAFT_1466325 [Armillaria fumosa]|nr:hypothetical protein IW262DRAFT_1466325 [Armillaria fumosa]
MADVAWTPRCSIDEADRLLTGPGSFLEIETRIIDGRVLKVWKNLWPSLRQLVLQSAKEHADEIYIVYEKERYTFREILEQSGKCAVMLRDLYGVKKDLLGAVTALVNILLPLEPLRHCITLTKCALIVLDVERADVIEPIATELRFASGASGYLVLEDHEGKGHWESMDVWSSVFSGYNKEPEDMLGGDLQILPEDDATITFTSGTTGLPKGVLSSQRAFLTPIFDIISLTRRDGLRRGEPLLPTPIAGPQEGLLISRMLSQTPQILSATLGAAQGSKVVLTRTWNAHQGKNQPRHFLKSCSHSIPAAAELCKTENITRLGGQRCCRMPSMVRELAESAISGIPIKGIIYGGTPIAASHLQRLKQVFPFTTIFQVYGLTETNASTVGFGGPDYDTHPDSCGFVSPVNEILVMKDGVKVVTGAVGEIWLRGPNVMKGYYGDKAATDQALTKDGWLMTGDLGRIDEAGYVYITDRMKDVIIRDGYNVDSIFVESALYTESGVLEAAVVGIADEQAGELPVAMVTLKPGYIGLINEEKLMAVAEKLLPEFAVPVMVIMHDRGFGEYPSPLLE